MRLIVDEEKCSYCLKCLKKCPNNLTSIKSVKCLHCNPEKAACLLSCSKNAIYEAADGILSIDEGLCDGCGECVKSCKYESIEIVNGVAKKCDLCAQINFFMQCFEGCEEGLIEQKRSWKDQKLTDEVLGWRAVKIPEEEKGKIIKKGNRQELIEKRDGKKILCFSGFPELTKQEAFLLKNLIEEFREEKNEEEQRTISDVLKKICKENSILLDEEQENYLAELASEIIFKFAPISTFLESEGIEEIALTGLGRNNPIQVYDSKLGWMETNVYFSHEKFAKNLVNRMARKIGRRLSTQTPRINAVLPNGCRINACIEPVSFSGPAFTIRKFRQKPFTPIDLISENTISTKALAFLWMVLQTDSSILLCGNTSSGKTTTLNALFSFISLDERIVIVEETPEIKIPHQHQLTLNTVKESEIGMQSLITDTLRMRPDRVIVGEVRNTEEVHAFIDTLLAGQGKGSYATFHAQSGEEALTRLRKLGVMEIDVSSIDLIIIQRRWNSIDLKKKTRNELRRIVEISEVKESKDKIELNKIFDFDYRKDSLIECGDSKKLLEKIGRTFKLNPKGIKNELRKREQFLLKLPKKDLPLEEFCKNLENF